MTDLIEVETADLVGEQLAWAVGKAEGLDVRLAPPGYNGIPWRVFVRYTGEVTIHDARYDPHENWAVGGSLLHKYNVDLSVERRGRIHCYLCNDDGVPTEFRDGMYGETHLIAACRCIVLNKLGLIVQVPKELCQ